MEWLAKPHAEEIQSMNLVQKQTQQLVQVPTNMNSPPVREEPKPI